MGRQGGCPLSIAIWQVRAAWTQHCLGLTAVCDLLLDREEGVVWVGKGCEQAAAYWKMTSRVIEGGSVLSIA
jgi:hypothetical protein